MRWQNKYKKIDKVYSVDVLNYSRIKKFKAPKWNRLKGAIKKIFFKRKLLHNQFIQVRFRFWYRLKNYFKDCLKTKNRILSSFQFFDSNKKTVVSRTLDYKRNIIMWLIKPYFNLACLLWLLGFCRSPYHAQRIINNSNVKVNNFYITKNLNLNKGDVVYVNCKNFLNKNAKRKILHSFIEIDYYTNTFIIIKDMHDLNFVSISLILNSYINLTQYKNYYR